MPKGQKFAFSISLRFDNPLSKDKQNIPTNNFPFNFIEPSLKNNIVFKTFLVTIKGKFSLIFIKATTNMI